MSNAIVKSAGKAFTKVGMKFRKHSPEIAIVAGTVGTVATVVTACKATTKLSAILEESKEQVEQIHECTGRTDLSEPYTEEDAKKDLAIVYAQTGLKVAKLYAPAIILGVASLACMWSSHNILRKRNVALAAAYATVDKSFKQYRSNVVERFGEQVDKELKYKLKSEKITEVETDPETGKDKKVKKSIEVTGIDGCSEYARFFDEASRCWEKDPELNLYFLRAQQQVANDRLISQGHLFLNEVYDMLDIPRTKAGQAVGWVYDEKNPIGDNYVDFGIYDFHREGSRDFVNGYERSILLDFNVDGPIWELI